MDSSVHKQVFLLQGPLGSFFEALSHRLRTGGYSVLDVCFNLGDRLNRASGEMVWFRGSMAEWRAELLRLCQLHRPQCFILFGDRRPVHAAACDVAVQLNIKVYSFEEGYLRPDYVTFEPDGNNARSRIVEALEDFAAPALQPGPRPVGKTFGRMMCHAIIHQWALAFNTPVARKYEHHRNRRVVPEALYWTRAWWRKLRFVKADARTETSLVARHSKRFFLVALQVHDDLQNTWHGAGWTQETLIAAAIASFARAAPSDMQLVIRYHPMDRGHKTYGPLVDRLARAAGVRGRVSLMYNGHGPTILAHAAGFISVNSTMALSAMHHGCPVLAFGDCFYRIPGLAAPGRNVAALDSFWADPPAVDHDMYLRFRALLLQETQINGSFYQPRFYPAMAAAVVARLRRDGLAAKYQSAPVAVRPWLDVPLVSGVPAE